jgi:hypothetical protein
MSNRDRLEAAGGLRLDCPSAGPWRVTWNDADWLGPLGARVHSGGIRYAAHAGVPDAVETLTKQRREHIDGADALGSFAGVGIAWDDLPLPLAFSVRAYGQHALIVFRIEALADVPASLATRTFADVSVAWPFFMPLQREARAAPPQLRTYAHQLTEFALPVFGDDSACGFMFAPHRPAVVQPLMFIAADGRALMLAPLDQFHEQAVAVPPDREHSDHGVRCGWHGDLSGIRQGFATELALWAAPGPRAALDGWCALLRRRNQTRRPSRYADEGIGKLSYWTDNGAVYYYRTEPGADYETTLERAVGTLHERRVPVRSVQIDSWFYPHQNLRPVSPEGAPIVPPSGMMKWEPRDDLFTDGFRGLRQRLGGLPLSFHSRHFSAQSPYFERLPAWVDGEYAHPCDSRLYEMLMAQAAAWGAITYEQDWMVESFFGVRGLREEPGRARAWIEGMDRAAREQGLTLQFCMATPCDFLQTTTLSQVTSIRTSGDYRYLFDNGLNWVWFLHGNALARALGLNPFKDVFLSHGPTSLSQGEPYAEIEALLAALSTGPVAIGDQIGATDREVVMRTCRDDGILVKPDVPLAAIDACFRGNTFVRTEPLIAEAYTDHPAGRWTYVASFHACQSKDPLGFHVALAELGESRPSTPVLAFDWRRGEFQRLDADGGWHCSLDFQDWDYRVLCPLLAGGVTVIGDVTKYATVGDHRVAGITCDESAIGFAVLDHADAIVEVHGYSPSRPVSVSGWVPGAERWIPPDARGGESWSWDATGRWIVRVRVGSNGHTQVRLEFASGS